MKFDSRHTNVSFTQYVRQKRYTIQNILTVNRFTNSYVTLTTTCPGLHIHIIIMFAHTQKNIHLRDFPFHFLSRSRTCQKSNSTQLSVNRYKAKGAQQPSHTYIKNMCIVRGGARRNLLMEKSEHKKIVLLQSLYKIY